IFSYQITDDQGATATGTLTFSVTGTNDGPVTSGALTDSGATEAGVDGSGDTVSTVDATGVADALFANVSDVDNDAIFTVAQAKTSGGDYVAVDSSTTSSDGLAVTGSYGTLTVGADGSYVYVINNTNGTIQALDENDTATDTFVVEVSDGSGGVVDQTINITIQGTNDTPITTGVLINSGAVEVGTTSGGAVEGSNATGTANSLFLNVTDVDDISFTVAQAKISGGSYAAVDSSTTSSDGQAVTGSYGTLTVGADGSYVYVVDNSNLAVQTMAAGASITDSFVIEVSDGAGGFVDQTLAIAIQGTNDGPVATLDSASVEEDDSVTGNVLTNDTDVDTGSVLAASGYSVGDTSVITNAVDTSLVGTYGTLTISADGSYSYVADQAAADALAVSVTASDVFTYEMKDENNVTDTALLSFTVTGTNDAAIVRLSGASSADNSATFTELTGSDDGTNAVSFATGDIQLSDVDSSTLTSVIVSIASSSLENGDELVLGSTVIDLTDTSEVGEVVYGDSVFSYQVSTNDTNRLVNFISLDASQGSSTAALIADYSALLSALQFNNSSDDFVNATSRSFSLSVTDDQGLASSVANFEVSMAATNDALSGVPTIDGTLIEGETLDVSLSALTDADGRNEAGFTYQWQRSSDNGVSWLDIDSATNDYYSLTRDDGLAQVRVSVTHVDAGNNTETVVSAASSQVAFSSVEGLFYDWYSQTVIQGVVISQGEDSATSGSDGTYSIGKDSDDGYSFALGIGDTGTSVDISDALLAFSMAFGEPVTNSDGSQISAYQYYAADIDEDGDVDISDAMDVFEMALGHASAKDSAWHFIDEQVDFWDELNNLWTVDRDTVDWSLVNTMNDGDTGAANFVAIQKGDINGSWASTSSYEDGNVSITSEQLSNLMDTLLPSLGSGDDWWNL
ncbi:VCBS domain-containing protein, partial [Alphaproteobacteria bacterium]|nr:VCBS domain-containing protein [Alphaproteobacteria bacterium]